ncbi:MAG: 8-oxo-dGTP diphosphatase [Butyrivibrio sp.]|nr:8-oxo-dGTP diphosphatase [Butyrivibrio sp.]
MRIDNITTVCYIEHRGRVLMLHRVKKKDDVNADKWLGVGGHLESGESPEECVVREVREETGIRLSDYDMRGVISFSVARKGDAEPLTELAFVFAATIPDGEEVSLIPCDEGELAWVPREEIAGLPVWEGDRIMFRLLSENRPFWSLKLSYDAENRLVQVLLGGKECT